MMVVGPSVGSGVAVTISAKLGRFLVVGTLVTVAMGLALGRRPRTSEGNGECDRERAASHAESLASCHRSILNL